MEFEQGTQKVPCQTEVPVYYCENLVDFLSGLYDEISLTNDGESTPITKISLDSGKGLLKLGSFEKICELQISNIRNFCHNS